MLSSILSWLNNFSQYLFNSIMHTPYLQAISISFFDKLSLALFFLGSFILIGHSTLTKINWTFFGSPYFNWVSPLFVSEQFSL